MCKSLFHSNTNKVKINGIYMCASQAWFRVDDCIIVCAVCGHDHIIAELRRERLYLALVSYGLFYQRIFVFDMIYII